MPSDDQRPSRTHWLASELRLTAAAWFALLLTLTQTVLLLLRQPPFQSYSAWTSSWAGGARWLSESSLVLGPLVATAAAWVGGRESRHRMGELLDSTSRPAWQRLSSAWCGVAAGTATGFLGSALVVTLALAPAVSYSGGRWPWAWMLVGLGWLACAGIGYGVGILVPGRLVPALVGLAIYVGCGTLSYADAPWAQLAPVAGLPISSGLQLRTSVIPLAILWLIALPAIPLTLAIVRHWAWTLVAALLAIGAGTVLLLPDHDVQLGPRYSWAEVDTAAEALVCTGNTPMVCVQAVHKGLLEDVVVQARQIIDAANEFVVLDQAAQAVGRVDSEPSKETLPLPGLEGQYRMFRRGMADLELFRYSTAFVFTAPRCDDPEEQEAILLDDDAYLAHEVAASLLHGGSLGEGNVAENLRQRFLREPEAARAWMKQYLEAAWSCDAVVVKRLGRI